MTVWPGQLHKTTYPDYFPCPTWEYTQGITEFTRRTAFDSGWVRQRKQWPQAGTTIELNFTIKTTMFDNWCRWVEANGHDWFAIPLERIAGVKQVVEIRFITGLSYQYIDFNTVDVRVAADMGGNATTGDGGGEDPGYPGIVQLPDQNPYQECHPYACDAVETELQLLVDHLFPLTSMETGQHGDGIYEGQTPDINGDGFAKITTTSPDHRTVIADACYTGSWYVDRPTLGFHGMGWTDEVIEVIRERSQGVFARAGDTNSFLQYFFRDMAAQSEAGGLGAAGSFQVRVHTAKHATTGNVPALVLQLGASGQYGLHVVPWSSLGLNPAVGHVVQVDTTHWVSGDFDGTSTGDAFNHCKADVYVNGSEDPVISATGVQTINTGVNNLSGLVFERDAGWIGVGNIHPTTQWGWLNHAFYNNSIIDDAVRAEIYTAFLRNHTGYTPPEWCPGPKP